MTDAGSGPTTPELTYRGWYDEVDQAGAIDFPIEAPRCHHRGVHFIRFEASAPNARGAHIGVFGLANGLRSANRLTEADLDWLTINNAYGDRASVDPGTVDPTLFDKAVHPHATCWFKSTATHLLHYVDGYLDLLTRYGVAWRRQESADPGDVLYEDDVQVVVEPVERRAS